MGVVEGIVAFLQVLPKILDLMSRLGALMAQNDFRKWIDNLEADINSLEQATDPKTKIDAAKRLVDDIRNLR